MGARLVLCPQAGVSLILFFLLNLACGPDYNGVYAACDVPDDCSGIVPEEVDAVCLDKSGQGFCTWDCETDTDCEGDQDEDVDFVCASFESTEGMSCFPSCEEGDTAQGSCPDGYTCRSTGGGEDNRRVCFPE